jgi:hypothetical protein
MYEGIIFETVGGRTTAIVPSSRRGDKREQSDKAEQEAAKTADIDENYNYKRQENETKKRARGAKKA